MQLENGESVVTAANVVPKYEVCNNAATNKTNKQKVNDFNPFVPLVAIDLVLGRRRNKRHFSWSAKEEGKSLKIRFNLIEKRATYWLVEDQKLNSF